MSNVFPNCYRKAEVEKIITEKFLNLNPPLLEVNCVPRFQGSCHDGLNKLQQLIPVYITNQADWNCKVIQL